MSSSSSSLNEEEEYYLIRLQANIRKFIIRSKLLKEIFHRYEKIFDPRRQRYYYYDKLKNTSSWIKPVYLLDHDLSDIAPTYLPSQAALKIQCMIRRHFALLHLRVLYQKVVVKVMDDSVGEPYYYNPKSGMTMWELPGFMSGRLDHEPRQGVHQQLHSDDDDEGEEDEDSDASSIDSERRRERRRKKRKYPRSKAQSLVDEIEDHFHTIFDLNLSHLQTRHITSRLYDLTNLTTLNLSYNRLKRIHPDIHYLSKLQVLNISFNRLQSLPAELRELKELRELNASHNEIASFSGHIYKLGRLEQLDLSYNSFTDLPLETGNLELLQELGLFEVGISQLRKLTHLNLSNCQLKTWPTQAEQVKTLKEIYLSNNMITHLPEDIVDLQKLEKLYVDFNQLKEIPSIIYQMHLKELIAHHNQVFAIPDPPAVTKSKTYNYNSNNSNNNSLHPISNSLITLDLSFNALTQLSSNLAHFQLLQRLFLQDNKISVMTGDCFNNLYKLNEVNLSRNLLTEISPSLGGCVYLMSVDISYNQLSEVPPSLLRCTKLKTLLASHNLLTGINGKIMTMLALLDHLELQYNQIVILPPLLFTIRKLMYVDLSHNAIANIPEDISHWEVLQYLDLSYNQISILPEELCSLNDLETLYLHYNSISSLPQDFVLLAKLKRLTLHHNALTTSPNLLLSMPGLIYCNLSDNPIQSYYYRWKLSHRKQEDTVEGGTVGHRLFSKSHIHKRLSELSDQIHRRSSSCHFISQQSQEQSVSKYIISLIHKLHAYFHTDCKTVQTAMNVNYAQLTTLLKDEESNVEDDTILLSMAKLLSAARRFVENRELGFLQHHCLHQLHRSERWGQSLLPTKKDIQELIDQVADDGVSILLDALPLGLSMLDNIGQCCELLDHLHQHMVASEMKYLTIASEPGYVSRASDCDEELGSTMLKSEEISSNRSPPSSRRDNRRKDKTNIGNFSQKPGGGLGFGSLFKKTDTSNKAAEEKKNTVVADNKRQPVARQFYSQNNDLKEVSLQEIYDSIQTNLKARRVNPWYLMNNQQLLPTVITGYEGIIGRESLKSLPLPILQLPTVLFSSSSTCQSHEDDSSYLWIHFETFLLLAKSLVIHVQHLHRSIRWLERESCQRFSLLDIAQRVPYHSSPQDVSIPPWDSSTTLLTDYEDLLGDIYTELTGELKETQKQQQAQQNTLASKRAEMRKQYHQIFTSVLPQPVEELSIEVGDSILSDKETDVKTPKSSSARPTSGRFTPIRKGLQKEKSGSSVAWTEMSDGNSATNQLAGLAQDPPQGYGEMLKGLLLSLRSRSTPETAIEFDSTVSHIPITPEDSDRAAHLIQLLNIYRQLLLLWAIRSINCALYLLQSQGFDVNDDSSLDAAFQLDQEDGGEVKSVPQRDQDSVLRLRLHARRCVYYRALIYQYFGIYAESLKSYRMYFQLSNRVKNGEADQSSHRVTQETLLDYGKVLLAMGQFKQAEEVMEKVIREYIQPHHPRKPTSPTSKKRQQNLPELLTPVELLPIDEEVALLYKFASRQVSELTKAGVFSADQKRLFHVQSNGYLAERRNWPPPEYKLGRGRDYWDTLTKQRQREHALKQEMALVMTRKEIKESCQSLQQEAEDLINKAKSILLPRS